MAKTEKIDWILKVLEEANVGESLDIWQSDIDKARGEIQDLKTAVDNVYFNGSKAVWYRNGYTDAVNAFSDKMREFILKSRTTVPDGLIKNMEDNMTRIEPIDGDKDSEA